MRGVRNEPIEIPFMVEPSGRKGTVIDRATKEPVTELIPLAAAQWIVYQVNHGENLAKTLRLYKQAARLDREGFSHGAIARELEIRPDDALQLIAKSVGRSVRT